TDVVDDDDDLRIARLARIETKIAGAARDDQTNVAPAGIRGDRTIDRVHHLLAIHRNLESNSAGTFVEPIDVLAEPKDLTVVDADAFEHSIAVKQAVVVNADLGIRLVEEFSVDVDLGRHGRLRF